MTAANRTDNNRLETASSPYLRMHAGNPVHWQPWDEAALDAARASDTPILLSIGYSACHWCHVMAHECFEDAAIAAAMNASFVNIKLDREERPDVDHVYQLAHQALRGRGGGWPLTAFLDPQDLAPFYIGTYFPPAPRHGLPGFPEVLQRVRDYFDHHRSELREQASGLQDWLQHANAGGDASTPDAAAAAAMALQRLSARFDPDWGGNLGAPKFPRATELEWLLDQHSAATAPSMAGRTLAMMASRGLQDHLGGGFFRYCVDAAWTIPHFEKMLYDNAQLLPVYARGSAMQHTEPDLRDLSRQAALGIVDWLARDMSAPSGAFYSAISADSEGAEGRFYLWTREQLRAALPDDQFAMAVSAFGLDDPPNFEGHAWHLLRTTPLDEVAQQLGRPLDAVASEYAKARRALTAVRASREHPLRDDKILTAWNALAISGLARSARLLGDPRCAEMAQRALAALRDSAWINGQLFANAAPPAARIPGFLDDHAFLLDALLDVMQLAFDPRDLEWSMALAEALLAQFEDAEHGGFWFSTPQHATPLARNRSWTDDALPNGNGTAILALLRLAHLVGSSRYLDAAERALRAASGALRQYPDACTSVLRALHEFSKPRTQIVVRCSQAQIPTWQAALQKALHDHTAALAADRIDAFLMPTESGMLPGILGERVARSDTGTAYVCSGMTCQAPVNTPDGLVHALHAAASA
ncbi:MAG TPA: thioredoxin domain-containing protein [Rhodanobacteraceae bacterium]|nr:thioredoxin domain-containing protein [Rhodanobacteraceae bacterium]